MYRQIFKPTEYEHTIPITIPHEWFGQSVEVIAFPIATPPDMQAGDDDDFYTLCGAWESDKSAEAMAEEFRAARNFRDKPTVF
ncbi:MAG: hypothetical protein LBS12_03565 [Prevotellaceae bacterium]|jgi:hypothetical protein|nr:hypothetical protein [Prevotellaceae bacterium]